MTSYITHDWVNFSALVIRRTVLRTCNGGFAALVAPSDVHILVDYVYVCETFISSQKVEHRYAQQHCNLANDN